MLPSRSQYGYHNDNTTGQQAGRSQKPRVADTLLQGNSITNQSIHHDMDGMECERYPLAGRVPVGSLAALALMMGRVWSLHSVSR